MNKDPLPVQGVFLYQTEAQRYLSGECIAIQKTVCLCEQEKFSVEQASRLREWTVELLFYPDDDARHR